MTISIDDLIDISVTKKDFDKIDLNSILEKVRAEHKSLTLMEYRNEFDRCLGNALENEHHIDAKIYLILAIVSGLFLQNPDKPQKPFNSDLTTNKYFSSEDLQFLKNILPEITDYFLQARIADVLWSFGEPRNPEHALLAIDAYIQYPLTKDRFFYEWSERAWIRAITLSKILRKKGEGKLRNIAAILLNAFIDTEADNTAFNVRLSKLMKEVREYYTDSEIGEIRNKLEYSAKTAKTTTLVQSYYLETIEWCKIQKNEVDIPKLRSDFVSRLETEIETAFQNGNEGAGGISADIEIGIKNLREIPNSVRTNFSVDERIEKLRFLKVKSDRKMFESMVLIQTDPIDITQMTEYAIKSISGKNKTEALCSLCRITSFANINQIKQQSLAIIKDNPLHVLFTTSHVDNSGHKIAETRPLDFSKTESVETSSALYAEMIKTYLLNVGYSVNGLILPALRTFNAEHHITELELLEITKTSAIVLPGYEKIWAKALYSGFENDFITSTHLLPLLFESLVRVILQQNEILTTNLDQKFNENEHSLGNLFNNKECVPPLVEFFGEDLLFELKALLTEKIGFNLRNKIAHGLINQNELMSDGPFYLWWLCLNLIIITSMDKRREN